MPAAGAVPDDADLPVGGRERPQGLDGALGVADELGVGDASGLPRGGRGVVGIHIEPLAGVEVGADGVVAPGGEAPRDLLGPRVPARQVVDDEDPAAVVVAGGERLVGVDRRPLVARERHVPGGEGFFWSGHGASFSVTVRVYPVRRCAPTMARRRCPPPGAGHDEPVLRTPVSLAGLAGLAALVAVHSPRGGRRRRRKRCHRAVVRTVVGPGSARVRRAGSRSMRPATSSSPTAGTAVWCWCRRGPGRPTACTSAPATPSRLVGGSCAGRGSLGHPSGLAVDAQGDVYIAEATAQRVQEVRAGGRPAAVTVAGTGRAGFNGDGLAGTASELDEPTGIALDGAGDLFIADTANCRVRVLAARSTTVLGRPVTAGHVSTVLGTGICGSTGQGGPLGVGRAVGPRRRGGRRHRRRARRRQRRPVRPLGDDRVADVLRHAGRGRRHRGHRGRHRELRAVSRRRALRDGAGGRAQRPPGPRRRRGQCAVRERRLHARPPGGAGRCGPAVGAAHEGGRPLHGRGQPSPSPTRPAGATGRDGSSRRWGPRSVWPSRPPAPSTTPTARSTRSG